MARKRYTGAESKPLNTTVVKQDGQIVVSKTTDVKQNEAFTNGLTDALFGSSGIPGQQLSQSDTIFDNLRGYMVSNLRQMLSQAYVEIGLLQTIVDVPVDDGLRGGVDITSEQLSEEQIQDVITVMEREEDLQTIGQALKWNRLFGGAGLIIMTPGDFRQPLEIAKIEKGAPLMFRDADMWELFYSQINIDDSLLNMDGTPFRDVEYYDYYSKKLHASWVMKMTGLRAPSFVRPRLRGWGFSVVEALVRSINQYLKATTLGFEVLDEFKLDIFKIKNLTNSLMSTNGDALIRKRVALAAQQKNYQNAITMDSEDDYIQKQLSFTGLAEAMHGIRMQVASDMRMPITKLFGISATGFNSGEDDIEVYNAMVESQVRHKCKFDIIRVIELRCQQTFGFVPDDISIDFKPLRVMSAEQEENVKTLKFNRLLAAKTAGELDSKEFRNACNRDNLLSIQLDPDKELLDVAEQGGKESGEEDGEVTAPAPPKSKTVAKDAPEPKS